MKRKGISLKKILTIICCLWSVLTASAVSYATPYKGSGRNGYIHTTMHHSHSCSHSDVGGLVQVPVAAMGATSVITRGMANSSNAVSANALDVRGIQTSASSIQGGVTTYDTEARFSPRRSNTPGHGDLHPDCEHCIDENGDDICDICGCDLLDGCTCDHCTCDVPITDGWQMWLFMTVMTTAYVMYKKWTKTV